MAIYQTHELLNLLHNMYNDGYDYIGICEDSDESSEYLSFEGYGVSDGEADFIHYEDIDSCQIPADYLPGSLFHSVNADDFCYDIPFTITELCTIKCAVDNALQYFKECSANSNCSKEEHNEIKRSSINCRNLQAKLNHFFKEIKEC